MDRIDELCDALDRVKAGGERLRRLESAIVAYDAGAIEFEKVMEVYYDGIGSTTGEVCGVDQGTGQRDGGAGRIASSTEGETGAGPENEAAHVSGPEAAR